jgi:hypothetical protein
MRTLDMGGPASVRDPMRTQPSKPTTRWFPLAVLLIIGFFVVLIGPEIASPIHSDPVNVPSQLRTIRSQIELYNDQNPATPYDETTPAGPAFWDRLVQKNYLQAAPENSLQGNSSVVVASPRAGAGWFWAEAVPGDPWTLNIYVVDEDGDLYSAPDTGQPY